MTAVFTSVTEQGLFQVHSRFENWFNWGIYDNRKWFDFAVFDSRSHDPETFLTVGFFGTDWALDKDARFTAIPAQRELAAPQHYPRYETLPDVTEVPLSNVMPASINQMRGAVGFDRSYRGYPLRIGETIYAQGFGVRAPSDIHYQPDGKFKTFQAQVGLQTELFETITPPRAQECITVFVVVGDGKELWKSPPLDAATPGPVPCQVDISKIKKLTLRVVSGGGPLWLHGSAAWVEPVLLK
jgi:hypothetical protein